MNFLKYDPLHSTTKESIKAETNDVIKEQPAWMSSSKVILLFDYLSKHSNTGIIIYMRGKKIGIRFYPGLNAIDLKSERGMIAQNIYSLYQDAYPDMVQMINKGITIPMIKVLKDKSNY